MLFFTLPGAVHGVCAYKSLCHQGKLWSICSISRLFLILLARPPPLPKKYIGFEMGNSRRLPQAIWKIFARPLCVPCLVILWSWVLSPWCGSWVISRNKLFVVVIAWNCLIQIVHRWHRFNMYIIFSFPLVSICLSGLLFRLYFRWYI